MIESTKDIFWLVLAFCILWFTLFVSLAVYYLAMILKEARRVAAAVRHKIELIDGLLQAIKDKMEKTSGHVAMLAEGVTHLIKYFMEKGGNAERKSKKKK